MKVEESHLCTAFFAGIGKLKLIVNYTFAAAELKENSIFLCAQTSLIEIEVKCCLTDSTNTNVALCFCPV